MHLLDNQIMKFHKIHYKIHLQPKIHNNKKNTKESHI